MLLRLLLASFRIAAAHLQGLLPKDERTIRLQ